MDQVEQKVRVLLRLRRYLEHQRGRFLNYLVLLEQQNAAIRSGDIDRLRQYIVLEQSIVGDIANLQRVIDPLKDLYRHSYPHEERSIATLESSLKRLCERVLTRNAENRRVLEDRLETLRLEIKEVSRRIKPALSPYARIGEPKLVDIRT
jgi:hypothetical protein